MIDNPKSYWQNISERAEWKDYILPRKNAADFDSEGFVEAQRLFYFFDNKSTVIDYGCGVGRVLKYVAERAGRVIGLDICQGFISKARPLATGNVEFFPSDEFEERDIADLVYCLQVMEHNNSLNQKIIMGNILEILKDGGTCIVSFPRHESTYYEENETLHKFTRDEVEAFGKMFQSYRIMEGNLTGYEKKHDGNNEYFLIAVK